MSLNNSTGRSPAERLFLDNDERKYEGIVNEILQLYEKKV